MQAPSTHTGTIYIYISIYLSIYLSLFVMYVYIYIYIYISCHITSHHVTSHRITSHHVTSQRHLTLRYLNVEVDIRGHNIAKQIGACTPYSSTLLIQLLYHYKYSLGILLNYLTQVLPRHLWVAGLCGCVCLCPTLYHLMLSCQGKYTPPDAPDTWSAGENQAHMIQHVIYAIL